jgi:hypothetical protein
MSRTLRTCLRAYPRDVRERDGDELLDLAVHLAADHGIVREVLGLVRGGWAERRRIASRRRRTAVALTAATASALAVLTWSAAAQAAPGRVEDDRFDCAGDCHLVEGAVAHRVDDGWTCIEMNATASDSWRCTLD